MGAIVDILAMHPANRTIELPFVFLIGELVEFFLVLFSLCLDLTLRQASLTAFCGFSVGILRCRTVRIFFKSSQLFLVKNTLNFTLFETLLACQTA